jgi:AraC-like DNA-binding protein
VAEVSRLIDPAVRRDPPDWHAVAKSLGMSYDTFRKQFARLAGMPPAQYRKARVMERAAKILLEPDSSLAEVAQACGFYDAFHFSRQFKKATGLSPSEFRRGAAPGR